MSGEVMRTRRKTRDATTRLNGLCAPLHKVVGRWEPPLHGPPGSRQPVSGARALEDPEQVEQRRQQQQRPDCDGQGERRHHLGIRACAGEGYVG